VIDKKQNDWKDIAAEAAKPDGVMLLDSAAVKGGGQFKIEYGMELARAQHVFEQEAKGEIEQISGVMGEMKGAETNASSGRAIISRQVQGTTMLAKLFDNYRRSRHLLGEILWATVQQLYTKPMHFRIRDQQGGYNFIDANTYVTDGSRILIQNDISKAEVDIVIDEQVFHATVRQAFFEQMMAMLGQLPPEIGLMLLPMAIEYSDLPQKDEMVRQIIEAKNLLMQRMGGGQPNQPKLPGGSPEGESLDRERQGIENTMLGGQA
jgi:hypothetical protein